MRKKPKDELSMVPLLNGEGQFTLFTDIPETIQKAHGPVVDTVMSQALDTEATILVDDTYEDRESIPIETRVMLSYQDMDIRVQGRHQLDLFDREVMDAVASLALHNEVISDGNIFQIMTGKRSNFKATPKQLEHVRQSMATLVRCRIQLDITDMLEANSPVGRKLKKMNLSTKYEGPLIHVETITVTNQAGTKSINCYKVLAQSALVRYAQALGKISEFPLDMLDTCVSKTERNIILQSFLLRSIDEMYRGESDPFIKAEDIYRETGIANEPRQVKERMRDTVAEILGDWQKKGYIKGFSAKKARSITRGYVITLDESKEVKELPEAPRKKR